MTLKEFALLMDRHNEQQEREDRRFGRFCALLANIYRKEGSKPFSEDDFIPKPPPRPQTPEQQVSILKTIGAFAQARYGGDRP